MAQEIKNSFPKIASSNWFGLRDKFKQRVPTEISPSYVATALGMSEASAGSNVVSPLKTLGIIDENGKPTDLAYDWRDDSKYKSVCEKVIKSIYPQELRDLFHDENVSQDDLKSWFMRQGKVGGPAARMYAQTYSILLSGDLNKVKESSPRTNIKKPTTVTKTKNTKVEKTIPAVESNRLDSENNKRQSDFSPILHLDIQIHISPESNADQIDKIFESMAKHLRGFKS